MNHTPEWHAERRKGIGGSDANIIMRGSPQDVRDLWLEKRGLREPENLDWEVPVQIGIATEELNIRFLERAIKEPIDRTQAHLVSVNHPFMRMNPDGLTPTHLIEAKHSGERAEMAALLERYTPQLTHGMIVTGRKLSILSVFFGNRSHEWQVVPLDEWYAADLIEREEAFWNAVQTGEPLPEWPVIASPVPPEQWRTVDMTGRNQWASAAADWLLHKEHAKVFGQAERALKDLMEPDVGLAHGAGVQIKRAKNSSLRITEAR